MHELLFGHGICTALGKMGNLYGYKLVRGYLTGQVRSEGETNPSHHIRQKDFLPSTRCQNCLSGQSTIDIPKFKQLNRVFGLGLFHH
jgi:hypothetical protein